MKLNLPNEFSYRGRVYGPGIVELSEFDAEEAPALRQIIAVARNHEIDITVPAEIPAAAAPEVRASAKKADAPAEAVTDVPLAPTGEGEAV